MLYGQQKKRVGVVMMTIEVVSVGMMSNMTASRINTEINEQTDS